MSGERLTLQEQGKVSVSRLSLTDDYWNWTTDLAPLFDIEGKSPLATIAFRYQVEPDRIVIER